MQWKCYFMNNIHGNTKNTTAQIRIQEAIRGHERQTATLGEAKGRGKLRKGGKGTGGNGGETRTVMAEPIAVKRSSTTCSKVENSSATSLCGTGSASLQIFWLGTCTQCKIQWHQYNRSRFACFLSRKKKYSE